MHGARTIGDETFLIAWSRGSLRDEKARLSLASLSSAAAPWSSIGLARAMSDYERPSRFGTQTAPTR
jgi:hypothetical protein